MAVDRAINFPLRVQGIGQVERDFRKVGTAGEQSFEKVEKAANGANKEVSEYTARLRRATDAAKKAFDRSPEVISARYQDPGGYQNAKSQFVLEAVNLEKNAMTQGLPETTEAFDAMYRASERTGASALRWSLYGAAAAAGLKLITDGVFASVEAFMEHEQMVSRFEAQLSLMGNRSEATGAQVRRMADDIAAGTRQSTEAALTGAQQLAQVEGLTVSAFEAALEASARYADATGRDLPDVLQSTTIPVLQALADRDLKAVFTATEDLNKGLAAAIRRMAEAGDTAGAQQALFQGLAQAAGNDEGGAANAADQLDKAWERLKINLGEDISAAAAPGISQLGKLIDWLTERVDRLRGGWTSMLLMASGNGAMGVSSLLGGSRGSRLDRSNWGIIGPDGRSTDTGYAKSFLDGANAKSDRAYNRYFERRYAGGGSKKGRGGGSGGSNRKSDAEREQEKLDREAERARTAADRIMEANREVAESYARRAEEARAKVGLEGEALAAIEDHYAVEAAVRRINTELIDKEMEARRAEAASKKAAFDEVANLAEVTALVNNQQAAVRKQAEAFAEASREIAEYNARQAQAKALLAAIETPMDAFNRDLETAITAVRQGDVGADAFDRYMDVLAKRMADMRYELDETAQAWRGYGDEVGNFLVDVAMNGGSAIEILQELIRMPLQRLLDQQLRDPVARFIDGLTGNDMDARTADARGDLPQAQRLLGGFVEVMAPAADGAAASLGAVQQQGYGAAQALISIQTSLGNPVDALAMESQAAAEAMGGLIPMTGEFGGALQRVIAMLASGNGGSAGGILSFAQLALGAISGGGTGPNAALVDSVTGAMAANPSIFSSGTDRVPTGVPFWVGENGRELMERTRGGELRVFSNQQVRRGIRPDSGGSPINLTVNVPARADPRRTASTVARGTQMALSRAARKGIASPAGSGS